MCGYLSLRYRSESRPDKVVLQYDGLKLYARREGSNYRLQWETVSVESVKKVV
jgi:hypothetical protein